MNHSTVAQNMFIGHEPMKDANIFIFDEPIQGIDTGSKQIKWIKATAGPKLVGSVAQDPYNIGEMIKNNQVYEGKFIILFAN